MSWQNEMALITRYLINDTSATVYSDEKVYEALCVGAQLMFYDVEFPQTYTIDADTLTISPDPTTLSTKDNFFINLACLKTACILLGAELRTYAVSSVKVTDGPSSIDCKGVYDALKDIYDTRCEEYEREKLKYSVTNSGGNGTAIITPTTVENISGRQYFS